MFSYQRFANNKPKLLIVVILTVVGSLSIPVLMPHIYHGSHIYHLLLHTSGIILSVFLAILSVNAYYKMRTKKMIEKAFRTSFQRFIGLRQLVKARFTQWEGRGEVGQECT